MILVRISTSQRFKRMTSCFFYFSLCFRLLYDVSIHLRLLSYKNQSPSKVIRAHLEHHSINAWNSSFASNITSATVWRQTVQTVQYTSSTPKCNINPKKAWYGIFENAWRWDWTYDLCLSLRSRTWLSLLGAAVLGVSPTPVCLEENNTRYLPCSSCSSSFSYSSPSPHAHRSSHFYGLHFKSFFGE